MMALIAVSVIGSAAADDASGVHHVKLACIGVKNKNDMPTVINMIQSDDKASLAQFVEDGEGIIIPAGARCYLLKSADFFTNWQIRVAGESGLWWVSVGWLDKN